MNRPRDLGWVRLLVVCLGLFGAAFAVTSLFAALPVQPGGTCGPGKGSESAAVALFDPITIGAGPEPPATNTAGRSEWSTFVNGCQSATDDRALVAFPILVVSVGIAIYGLVSLRRKDGAPDQPVPLATLGGWTLPPIS